MRNAKENYLAMLRGEIPDYIPSMYEQRSAGFNEELLTPVFCPDGPITTVLGVRYVGSPDLMNGALPEPGFILLDDITKWRDVIKAPDLSDYDWEKYYHDKTKDIDRSTKLLHVVGGDYFLTLISFMGFENAMIALYEEPEEVMALLEYVSAFYIKVLKEQIRWTKPDTMTLMDDDAAYRAPFFSVDMYREFFKPFHKLHCDLARENGILIERHDCGRSESFVPDWIDLGIVSWTPAQATNDIPYIKKTYGDKIAIVGGWDNLKYDGCTDMDELRAALKAYVDLLAPGGRFSFAAMGGGRGPDADQRRQVIKDFYFDYAKDWYRHH